MALGWKPVTGAGSAVTHYEVTGDAAPYVGWGFIRVKMFRGDRSFEAFWFHKSQFSPNGINAATKQRQIEWNHPQMNVQGMGVYLDSSGTPKYFDWMEFETEAAAQAWLFARANITQAPATTE